MSMGAVKVAPKVRGGNATLDESQDVGAVGGGELTFPMPPPKREKSCVAACHTEEGGQSRRFMLLARCLLFFGHT